MGRRATADGVRMGGRVRRARYEANAGARVAMDTFFIRPLSRLPAARGRCRRIQRQVHGRAGGAARKQLRHARGPFAQDLSQFLPAGGTMAVRRVAPRQGRNMLTTGHKKNPIHLENGAAKAASSSFATEMRAMLATRPRSISPKWYYDERGSQLFDAICELPEYSPTRTELGILAQTAGEIAQHIGPRAEIVEFGAGSLRKVRILLDAMDEPARYLPIDISGEHLARCAVELQRDYPGLDVQPVVADYTQRLLLPAQLPEAGRRVGFFPGSTLGNFTPEAATHIFIVAGQVLRGGA